jgi:hypothetical protein
MNIKDIKIGDKTITIKELSFDEGLELSEIKDTKESTKKLILLATNLSEEQRKVLTIKEGFELIKAINEFNGLTEDFLSGIQPK